jgi:hypothetical protein
MLVMEFANVALAWASHDTELRMNLGTIAPILVLAFAIGVSAAEPSKEAAAPPGYTMSRQGHADDFAFFEGAWTTRQHKLKARGSGSTEWEDFPAVLCMTPYLGGGATVDELWAPTQKRAGLTLRLFDPAARQWSIYWANGTTGKLDPVPVVGGFEGTRGEFYNEDRDGERPIKVRYVWTKIDPDHARWEQAFSYDDRTWETNWTADFTRGDAAALCSRGAPHR